MTRVAASQDNLVTVDLEAIAANLAALREVLPQGLGVAGVVKADAYGHGIAPVARLLERAGVEALAVASVPEGVLLRRQGIQAPILVMMGLMSGQALDSARYQLTPFLSRLEDFQALESAAAELGVRAPCQLKVDTGMSRLGAGLEQALEIILAASRLPHLELTGLVSHLATAGIPDNPAAQRQAEAYAELLGRAREQGLELPLSSLANSGGSLAPPAGLPQGPGLVRLGISLYGGQPEPSSAGRIKLIGAMRFTSRLAAVRPVKAGQGVSYGLTWSAPRDGWLGVVAAGYSDGYLRSASNRAQVLINGRPAPVRGRVCMNATVVDLEGFDPLPRAGDEVVLLGRQGGNEITADELGEWAGTISYEITCSLGASNRRRYRTLDPAPAAR